MNRGSTHIHSHTNIILKSKINYRDMVKNKKNNNNDSYDEQIEHLFLSETKASSNRKQGMENEKKPKILDELEVENYSHILYPIEFAIASHHVENPNTTIKCY
ncbi:MAG: hypothetical protein ACYDAJ_02955 [Nitrosotalea sp.]